MSVLISGSSIAGPALGHWLSRYGVDVTIVERATEVRPGGQEVDFKGATHHAVLDRMGILEAVRELHVPAADGAIVDTHDRTIGKVPSAFFAGDINVPRGDLARLLHERTATTCEYVFGDSIAAMTQMPDRVEVTFEHAAPRAFDLVVGADGMHSNVRSLAFGAESEYVAHLGYYYALADLGAPSEDAMYNEPSRMVTLGGGKAPAFFVFASPPLAGARGTVEDQKRLLVDAYRGGGWKIPEILGQIPAADPFYFDSISRVTMDRYSTGRVALLGDAAYGNALGGFGTGLALVGAYVLAGELLKADGDHRTAFARYEAAFRDYASVSQKVNAGRLLAPPTRRGIYLRNKLFSVGALFAPLMKLTDRFANDIDLEDYRGDGDRTSLSSGGHHVGSAASH